MAFEVLTVDDSRWPELVRQSKADIFYEPSYSRFLTEGTGHRPLMLLYEDELGKVFDVTMVKAISSLPFFADVAGLSGSSPVDLASPDYNSPIIMAESRDHCELLKRYRCSVDQFCTEIGAVTEFVRFHPFSESVALCASIMNVRTGAELLYIDLRAGYERACEGYRKGHKSTVKKAAREGATVCFPGPSDNALKEVSRLYLETMQRKDAKSVYLHDDEYFQELLRYLGDRVLVVHSLVGKEIASANIFLLGRKYVWFKYSGLNPQLRSTGAHTYMMDRVIYWACEHGFDYFMLGGGIDPGDSTYAFKRGFSHLSAQVHHMKKVHDEKTFAVLCEAKQKYDSKVGHITRTDYFPSYWLA